MSKTLQISLSMAALLAIVIVRWLPHPERSAHGFGDLFHTTPDPLAAQMRILPDATEDHFSVVETQGLNCEADNWENQCAPPLHYHTFQTEEFKVTKGSILMKQDGEITKLSAGDKSVIVPIGARHTFIRTGTDEVEMTITLRPNPGAMHAVFRIMAHRILFIFMFYLERQKSRIRPIKSTCTKFYVDDSFWC